MTKIKILCGTLLLFTLFVPVFARAESDLFGQLIQQLRLWQVHSPDQSSLAIGQTKLIDYAPVSLPRVTAPNGERFGYVALAMW